MTDMADPSDISADRRSRLEIERDSFRKLARNYHMQIVELSAQLSDLEGALLTAQAETRQARADGANAVKEVARLRAAAGRPTRLGRILLRWFRRAR